MIGMIINITKEQLVTTVFRYFESELPINPFDPRTIMFRYDALVISHGLQQNSCYSEIITRIDI